MAIVPVTRVEYTGNGVTTDFSFPFDYEQEADVYVTVNDVDTVFTFATSNIVSISPAPEVGSKVVVFRSTPALAVPYIFENGVPFLTKLADSNWRQLLYIVQEFINENLLNRLNFTKTLRTPDVVSELPAAVDRANKLVGFDGAGNPVVLMYTPTSVPGLDARVTVLEDSVIPSWVAIGSTVVTAVGQLFTLAQHTSNDIGGGFLISKAGSVVDNNITRKNSGTPGYYLERIGYTDIVPAMAGAKLDGITNDSNALESTYALNKVIKVSNTTIASSTNIREVVDAVFVGEGSVSTIYRKPVISYVSKGDDFYSADVIPAKHCKRACVTDLPVVVLFGDSIGTYAANTASRGDMLVEALRKKLQQDYPNGVTFYNRSIGGQGYGSAFGNHSAFGIPWYPAHVNGWVKDVCDQLNPDVVIFAFGMNDGDSLTIPSMKSVFDYIIGRTKVPDILVCTNLVPRIATTNVAAGQEQTTMDGRDYAAGLIRTYVQYRGFGLIDFHRKNCKAQDGFDPASTTFKQNTNVTLSTGGGTRTYTAASDANERMWNLYFNDSDAWFTSGGGIIINFRGGYLQMFKSGANLGITFHHSGESVQNLFVPYTPSNTLTYNLTVEIVNGWVLIYANWNPATGYGGYEEPIFAGKVAYGGGLSGNTVNGIGLMNVGFWEGETIKNTPSIINSTLWGIEGGANPYQGSGWNHPSHWIAASVYRQTLDCLQFYTWMPAYDFREVSVALGSAVALTSNVNTVIMSFVLPKGVWEISGTMSYLAAGSANVSLLKSGATPNGSTFLGNGLFSQLTNLGVISNEVAQPCPPVRLDLAVSTTISLTARASFTPGTVSAYGYLRATRVHKVV